MAPQTSLLARGHVEVEQGRDVVGRAVRGGLAFGRRAARRVVGRCSAGLQTGRRVLVTVGLSGYAGNGDSKTSANITENPGSSGVVSMSACSALSSATRTNAP